MVKSKSKKETPSAPNLPKLALSTRIIQKCSVGHKHSQSLQILCQTVSELDNGKYSLAFASGCGILSSILMMLSKGDHVLFCDDVYGGTRRYATRVAVEHHGITCDFIDLTQSIEIISKSINHKTKLLWIESPTNPTLKCCDIKELCAMANKYQLMTVMDNTFCSGINQCPLLLGADITLNSATKYMGGHSDVILGTITTNSQTIYSQLKAIQQINGTIPADFECGLVLRGLKTLAIRQKYLTQSAIKIAKWLEKHPKVTKVIYPGLDSFENKTVADKQMLNYSGMITFYIDGDLEKTKQVLSRLHILICAESLGGVESLIEVPSIMTHGSVPHEERLKLNITDNMIRVSIGIENTHDIIQDLDNALSIL